MRTSSFILACVLLLLVGCGGSNGSSLVPNSAGFQQGNFITTTVDIEQQFLYTLNSDNTVSAWVVSGDEEEAEEEESVGLSLRPLDGSPFTLSASPLVDLVVTDDGTSLFLLESNGGLLRFAIDGQSGLLTPFPRVETGISNARLLKLSEDGTALAALGDELAIYAVREESLSQASVLEQTGDWSDVAVSGTIGIGATGTGAVGFSWAPNTIVSVSPAVSLPGNRRGQVAYAAERAYVLNSEDNSISSFSQERNSSLTLIATSTLDAILEAPFLLVATPEQDQLLSADSGTVTLIDIEGDSLNPRSFLAVEQAPTRLFPVVGTDLVLVGHTAGRGFTTLSIAEGTDLELAAEADPDAPGTTSFGDARRNERVTQTVKI